MNAALAYICCVSGPEYGTTEAAWKAILVEADRRCDLHNRVKEDLHIKTINQLKQWQKDNYHKVSNLSSLDSRIWF